MILHEFPLVRRYRVPGEKPGDVLSQTVINVGFFLEVLLVIFAILDRVSIVVRI